MLRDWRQRRRLSQLDLALEAGVSARHLSFVETGRAKPSPEMVLHLAEQLEVPLRERNQLLLAAGYAPRYGGARRSTIPSCSRPRRARPRAGRPRAVSGDRGRPRLEPGRLQRRARGCCSRASRPSCWCRRSTACGWRCIPRGWRRGSSTSGEWRAHLLHRLERQIAADRRPERRASCSRSCAAIPGPTPPSTRRRRARSWSSCDCDSDAGELAFFSTVTTFGTAVDITVSELSIEAFFPADARTTAALGAAVAVN